MSDHFLGWIFALGNGVKIVGSDEAVKRANDMVGRLTRQYQ